MKLMIIAAFTISTAFAAIPASAMPTAQMTTPDEFSHGGGCRKSSPPGQCCHMKRATGVVHCH